MSNGADIALGMFLIINACIQWALKDDSKLLFATSIIFFTFGVLYITLGVMG